MTTEIEKKFFDTFGIEKQPVYSGSQLYNPFITGYEYPQITDRILLELICIVYKAKNRLNSEIDIFELNVENLKSTTLKRLIWINNTYKNEHIKQQVKSLFKVG